MAKILQTKSTLTDRYQTTIPEPIRIALHLGKGDKIAYVIETNGRVMISRANPNDPILSQFLVFLANDIKNNPAQIQTMSTTLRDRAQALVANVEIDLDAPLSDKDE